MPVPKGTRFRYRTITPKERQRLAFKNKKVIEVSTFKKKNGWKKIKSKRIKVRSSKGKRGTIRRKL